jgi:hypothetical protein
MVTADCARPRSHQVNARAIDDDGIGRRRRDAPRRLEQVALRQSSLESARASLARARGGSDSG